MAPDTLTSDSLPTRKPRDDELDVYGLTHQGLVRKTNQDHFLIGALRKQLEVYHTSLPDMEQLRHASRRLAYIAMVADGVGSGRGEDASRQAIQDIIEFVTHSMHCYYTADPTDEKAFSDALEEAAIHCHVKMLEHAKEDGDDGSSMATTLTLFLSVWPRSYILQVGDSRCYIYRQGTLTQISRDQTMGEDLVDQGVFTRSGVINTRWVNVLSSAIGGRETAPVVTGIDRTWDDVGLLCSDGLTKHVSDDQIKERLRTMTSSQQACEALRQDALDDGGSDNITIIIGRIVRKDNP